MSPTRNRRRKTNTTEKIMATDQIHPITGKRPGYYNPAGVAECIPRLSWCGQPIDDWQDAHPDARRLDEYKKLCPNLAKTVGDTTFSAPRPSGKNHSIDTETAPTRARRKLQEYGGVWLRMLDLLDGGWQPFPRKPNKSPLIAGYCAGSKAMPVTEEVILGWRQQPAARKMIEGGYVGVRMPGHINDPMLVHCDTHGTECGAWCFGIDIDHIPDKGKHGGTKLYEEATRRGLPMLQAGIVNTSNPDINGAEVGWGHGHYIFRICGKQLPQTEADPTLLEAQDCDALRPTHRYMAIGTYNTDGSKYVAVDQTTREKVSTLWPSRVSDLPQLTDHGWITFLAAPPRIENIKTASGKPGRRPGLREDRKARKASHGKYVAGNTFRDYKQNNPMRTYLAYRGFTPTSKTDEWIWPGSDSGKQGIKSVSITKSGNLIVWAGSAADELGVPKSVPDPATHKYIAYDVLGLETAAAGKKWNNLEDRTQLLRDKGLIQPRRETGKRDTKNTHRKHRREQTTGGSKHGQ